MTPREKTPAVSKPAPAPEQANRKGPRRPSRRNNSDFSSLPHTGVTVADTLAAAGVGPEHHVMSVPLTDVVPNPHNPRDDYDDDRTHEMADTYSRLGQLHPITVVARDLWLTLYPDDLEDLGTASWVAVLGNRRWYAAEIARLPEVRIEANHRLKTVDDIEDAILIENVHREPLPKMREAEQLASRVKAYGSQRKLAAKIHKSQPWIAQRLSLLTLAPELQDEIRAGTLSFENARWLAGQSKTHSVQRDLWAVLRALVPELQAAMRSGVLPLERARSLAELEHDQQRAEWAARSSGTAERGDQVGAVEADPAAAVQRSAGGTDAGTSGTGSPGGSAEPAAVPAPRAPENTAASDAGDYGVITPDTDPRSASRSPAGTGGAGGGTGQVTIVRFATGNMHGLAVELRRSLSADQVAELVEVLSADPDEDEA